MYTYDCDKCNRWKEQGEGRSNEKKKGGVSRKAPLEVRRNREEAMERGCLHFLSLGWPRDKVD